MSFPGGVTFSLTLMINKEKNKVLFASVDSAFADVLLSFLAFPLGGILKLLDKHYGKDKAPSVGSLKALYNGLQNLDSVYFNTEAGKQMLLNPRSSLDNECRKLKLNVLGTPPTRYFTCGCSNGRACLYYAGVICTVCRKIMNTEFKYSGSNCNASDTNAEVFAKQAASFIISDDLQMLPNATGSIIQNLGSLRITDMRGFESKIVTVGLNEIMDLLKVLLLSSSPLTDLFLHNGQIHHPATATAELERLSLLPQDPNSTSKKMKVKVMMQKSSKKFLFAQAGEDFVEFLFSLLTIPLGQVECLLDMNSFLGSIDSLYRSLSNIDGVKCLKTYHTKESLLKPKLCPKYLSNKHVFPLEQQLAPTIYFHRNTDCASANRWSTSSCCGLYCSSCASFEDPNYMKESGMFMVMDDLTVTPLHTLTSLSTLMGFEIPLSDIQELEINVGLEEAKRILKASLTSTSALTNGLKLNATLMKQPKQERA